MALELIKKLRCLIFTFILVIYIVTPSIDFLPFQNPTVSGKFFAFLFLIEVSALLFFVERIFALKLFSCSLIDLLFIGVIGYITFNRYVIQSIYGFSIRYIELLGLLVLYLILRSKENERFFYMICLAAVIGADIQIIIGNLQLYGFIASNNSFFKSTGSFFNSGPFAGYLASVLPISLFMLKNNKIAIDSVKNKGKGYFNREKIAKYINLFNVIGCFSLVPVLKSRASFLSVLCAIVLVYRNEIFCFLQNLFKKKIIKYVILLILILSMAVGTFFLISFKQESSKGHYLVLKVTKNMIKDSPIFGFGYDRFRSTYMAYQAQYFQGHHNISEASLADDIAYAFNEPLQFIVENGIVGFFLAIIFLYFLLKYVDKRNNVIRLAIIGLFSIFVFSLFSYPSEILPIKLISILYISILATYYDGPFQIEFDLKKFGTSVSFRFISTLLLLCVLIMFFQSFKKTIKLKEAYSGWEKAYLNYNNNNFVESKIEYESLFPTLKRNGDFLTDYGKTLFFLQKYNNGINILSKARLYSDNTVIETALGNCQSAIRDYKNAEESYLMASNMKPNSFYNKYLLFKLYEKSKQITKTVNVAKEILSLKVKVQSEATDAIRNEAEFFLNENDPSYKFSNL